MPKEEEDENKSPRFIREEDLEGHMTGEGEQGSGAPEKGEKEKETDEKAKELLERDNQVRQALHLLKSWDVFSKIKSTS